MRGGGDGGLAHAVEHDQSAVDRSHIGIVGGPYEAAVGHLGRLELGAEHQNALVDARRLLARAKVYRRDGDGLLLSGPAIEERQQERLGGVESKSGVAALRLIEPEGAIGCCGAGDGGASIAQFYLPLGVAGVPSQLALGGGTQAASELVGERPAAGSLALGELEAQHIGIADIGGIGERHHIEILRLLHAVDVGSGAAIAEYHQLVALVEGAFSFQFLVTPTQRRLKTCALGSIILDGNGVEIDRALGCATLDGDDCLVGGKGGEVELARHVDIDAQVLAHPASEPLVAAELGGSLGVDRGLSVGDDERSLALLVVGAHAERDVLDAASLPALEHKRSLAVARYLVVAVACSGTKVIFKISPGVVGHAAAGSKGEIADGLVVFHDAVDHLGSVDAESSDADDSRSDDAVSQFLSIHDCLCCRDAKLLPFRILSKFLDHHCAAKR